MRQEMRSFEDGQIDSAPIRRRPRRLSQLFAQMARDAEGSVSVSNIRDALGDRSFAALIVFFAALNLIPLPPPSSAILGLPLIIVSAQMMFGNKRAWLPRFVMESSISAEAFRSVMERLIPRLISLERMIKPRYWPFWRRHGDRVIGVMCFILAVIVTLPIPLGNWLPAFSSSLLGLALVERDGILFAIGTAIGVVAIAVIVAVFGSATALISFLLTSHFFHI
jgi:hypothetical protein